MQTKYASEKGPDHKTIKYYVAKFEYLSVSRPPHPVFFGFRVRVRVQLPVPEPETRKYRVQLL